MTGGTERPGRLVLIAMSACRSCGTRMRIRSRTVAFMADSQFTMISTVSFFMPTTQ